MSGALIQSVLLPTGAHSSFIHGLWLLMLWTSGIVFAVVLGAVLVALARGIKRHSGETPVTPDRTLDRSIVISTVATAVVLIALLTASVWTGRGVASLRADAAVSIDVIGHQWWWEFEYEDGVPSRRVLTANELHMPSGRPVVVKVTSRDVIHSFWVPNLQGKRDLIPGMTTAIWLQPNQVGRFRGQCAEFCGLQHAHMAFDVVVEPEADFERWLDHQRAPSVPPADGPASRGLDLFTTQRCGRCHTVRGTEASGQAAPDLTHLASRLSIAAGTLPNSAPHRRAFVRDPQATKPGTQMPPNPFSDEDLSALMAYLDTLQ
jgi:cytochrome c oxidase subunit II